MPASSENGWPVLTDAPPAVEIPGSGIRVRIRGGDVAAVLAYVAGRFNGEVERLDLAVKETPGYDDWGWAWRPVRGQTSGFSNHASATAIDLNATRHPLGVRGTFTIAQVAAVRRILADLRDPDTGRCVVRWGEDYTTTVDGMHFEINADAAAVSRVAKRISGRTVTPADTASALTLEDRMFIANVAGKDKRAFLVNPPFKMLLTKDIADELRAKGVKDAGEMTGRALSLFATVDTSSVAELVEVVPGQVSALHRRQQP